MVVYFCLIAILICPMKTKIDSEKNTQVDTPIRYSFFLN